ncbi:hypothetical protein MIND_00168100 [Mycena indigotica]|uniref:Uncharacterized protein n=1 Tax=Mycena indigotica TaxID=2126181 RepID=A0A8H6TCV5_9AGAR|nr:uncharacterized protein MIND_00168100 [Mycena indigotica]KAF7316490.1 hypothetical protein MIND_00168100 [Mycena indigotica]
MMLAKLTVYSAFIGALLIQAAPSALQVSLATPNQANKFHGPQSGDYEILNVKLGTTARSFMPSVPLYVPEKVYKHDPDPGPYAQWTVHRMGDNRYVIQNKQQNLPTAVNENNHIVVSEYVAAIYAFEAVDDAFLIKAIGNESQVWSLHGNFVHSEVVNRTEISSGQLWRFREIKASSPLFLPKFTALSNNQVKTNGLHKIVNKRDGKGYEDEDGPVATALWNIRPSEYEPDTYEIWSQLFNLPTNVLSDNAVTLFPGLAARYSFKSVGRSDAVVICLAERGIWSLDPLAAVPTVFVKESRGDDETWSEEDLWELVKVDDGLEDSNQK